MLSAEYRLKNKKVFNDIFRQGKTVSNDVLLLKYKDLGTKELKIGFSVGVKFSKKSSKRNRAKRWMREATREMIGNIQPGWQIIFLINSKFPYEQMSYALIQERLKDLLRKAKLLK